MSPDGYKFFILPEDQPASDPVVSVALNSTNLEKSIDYWSNVLNMNLISKSDTSAVLAYNASSAQLKLQKIGNFGMRLFCFLVKVFNLTVRCTNES